MNELRLRTPSTPRPNPTPMGWHIWGWAWCSTPSPSVPTFRFRWAWTEPTRWWASPSASISGSAENDPVILSAAKDLCGIGKILRSAQNDRRLPLTLVLVPLTFFRSRFCFPRPRCYFRHGLFPAQDGSSPAEAEVQGRPIQRGGDPEGERPAGRARGELSGGDRPGSGRGGAASGHRRHRSPG